jgi:putative ABC transport system substrate-binding protein
MRHAGRRRFLVAATVLAAAPLVRAQPSNIYRIGVLSMGQAPAEGPLGNPYLAAMAGRLRELGYAQGSNLRLEAKWAAGKADRLPALAAELVASKVDIILASGDPCVDAARRATPTVPIVMIAGDPVAAGFVQSLSHPAGNLTGMALTSGVEVWSKRLQLLKLAVPNLQRVAVLSRSRSGAYAAALQRAAKELGIALVFSPARRLDDLPGALLAAIERTRPDALFVSDSPLFFQYRAKIVEFAAQHRLPDIHGYREAVQDGALMSYAADLEAAYRQIASFVDRLFKGARPGDLPIERPTKFALVVNAKTARTLGIELPQSLLVSADQVIE